MDICIVVVISFCHYSVKTAWGKFHKSNIMTGYVIFNMNLNFNFPLRYKAASPNYRQLEFWQAFVKAKSEYWHSWISFRNWNWIASAVYDIWDSRYLLYLDHRYFTEKGGGSPSSVPFPFQHGSTSDDGRCYQKNLRAKFYKFNASTCGLWPAGPFNTLDDHGGFEIIITLYWMLFKLQYLIKRPAIQVVWLRYFIEQNLNWDVLYMAPRCHIFQIVLKGVFNLI